MSNSPVVRKARPRPKINLPISGTYGMYPQTPIGYIPAGSYGPSNVPITPLAGQPNIIYANKAREFMFSQFRGIKDITKTGLSFGEKCAFWLYEKVSSWSKRWFTHIFLFLIVLVYSVAGAMIFVTVEGSHEENLRADIRRDRNETLRVIKLLIDESKTSKDPDMWKDLASNQLHKYEAHLYEYFKRGFSDSEEKVWTFWNAVFYCGTIFTTIECECEGAMEDSYTVHRRRKAAAKKREKTPEPSEYPANEEEASEDDGEARKKMEQMVEDTERMHEDVAENKSDSKNSAGELTEETEKTVEVERESPEVEAEKPLRTRRKRDNQEDSSDVELQKRALRKKSPEEAKLRTERKKTPSKTRKEVEDEGREKRGGSRHRHSGSEEENGSKRTHRRKDRSTSRHAYDSESDEGRSSKPRHKKQVILLRDDSLMDDLVKAEKEYVKRDYSLEDEEDEECKPVRRRKPQKEEKTAEEKEEVEKPKRSWFSWVPFFGRKKEKIDEPVVDVEPVKEEIVEEEKVTIWEFFKAMIFVVSEFKEFMRQNPGEMKILLELRNTCINELILGLIYCGVGGLIFRFTEGAFESFYKCGVKRVKRDFLDSLWSYSHSMKEEDWKSMARRKLMEFEEQIHTAHEAGVQSYSGQRSWTFLNAVVYCITVVTTIGYGHISPSTTTGRAITIIYAIFGIPMFLIILADFGKLFTRCIKFLWAFVRRLYYTGSCRKVRRTVPVQEVMKGVQLVYDLATFRRPSQMNPEDLEEMQKQAGQSHAVLNLDGNVSQPDTPGTPAMSTFDVDDEFNLPISVAIFILLGYIFVGATLFYMWEDWGFFESFYFVFISMSTIGFGDYVPNHPIYMMCSIVYLVFGLALTSMCINVVQVMLSDQFQQASQKIGTTIGLQIVEEDGSIHAGIPPGVEMPDVHSSGIVSKEGVAPKAKPEEVNL